MSTAYHRHHPQSPANNGVEGQGQGQLCQPTKLLGCLRTVGRPTSKANPLLVAAKYAVDRANIRISHVDVKLVDVATGGTVAHLDRQGDGHFGVTGGLLCLVGPGDTAAVSLLEPATGDVYAIPALATGKKTTASAYVFGHVPATGEHKVLRVYSTFCLPVGAKQTCEILTLGGDGGADEQQRWRPAPSAPVPRIGTGLARHWAVTANGVAYFLIPKRGAAYDAIASFDMATEKWRPALLRCPLPTVERHCCNESLSLVELNGCLAFVHHDYRAYVVDMWVMTSEMDGGSWLRVEPLPLGKVLRDDGGFETLARPLMVLEDGRIAFLVRGRNCCMVRVYDPRTGHCEEVVNFGKYCSFVGLYKGKLLGVE